MCFRPQFPFSIPRAGPCAIGSFAEPASVRGFKFVDMLGGTEVMTPFYLVGRAGVGGQGTGSALMGAPKCRGHTIARVAPLDSVSQIPFVHRRNATPPAHTRMVRFLAVVGLVLARSVWCARSCGALASLGRQTTVPTLNLKSLGFAANFLSGAGRQGALAAPEGELAAKPRDACCVLVTRRRVRHAPPTSSSRAGQACLVPLHRRTRCSTNPWPWVQPWL